MKCDGCGSDLKIAGSRFVSEEGSTDVFTELKMVCINQKCDEFAGYDLTNATKFKTLRRKVN
jgi:hypothetical protein